VPSRQWQPSTAPLDEVSVEHVREVDDDHGDGLAAIDGDHCIGWPAPSMIMITCPLGKGVAQTRAFRTPDADPFIIRCWAPIPALNEVVMTAALTRRQIFKGAAGIGAAGLLIGRPSSSYAATTSSRPRVAVIGGAPAGAWRRTSWPPTAT
jgi:hypothetical protein